MNKTKLPTEAQIKNLHKKYAKNDTDFALIYAHCQVVNSSWCDWWKGIISLDGYITIEMLMLSMLLYMIYNDYQ